ncbi:hypothetical protein [Tenacibaculum sp. 190524A02b]|uniref:Roadblock/LC7 domain-containing protein n=1 Tax=Tenacibaculum vairaonense TaxID=3137860 RepID=A0ABP1FD86_9FLAO
MLELQELLNETNSKAVYLINKKGEIIDSFVKSGILKDIENETIVFGSTIFNMSDHFFENYINSELKEIILKSTDMFFLLIKHMGSVLCFVSDKNINVRLLELVLQKKSELTTN